MKKHPTWSLKTLREKSYKALMDVLTARPAGARFVITPKPSVMSVKRCAPCCPTPLLVSVVLSLRILNKAVLKNYKAAKVPFLSKRHMSARAKFARETIAYDFTKV